jgi:multiple sugar transport system ATP-binding protein
MLLCTVKALSYKYFKGEVRMKVKVENLTKAFNETIAVNEITATFESGKLIGLLGPSGCGKSTTLFMLAGLHKPTGGRIYFGDEDVTDLPPEKRGIGLVFQNYALYPHLTVEKNIMFPLENMKIPRAEAKEIAYEMAKLVQIETLLDRKPKQLSGGQQQRVAIARALAKKPRILLLDEPLSNLDARLRLETREEIKRIQQETGVTTIFVTHDQEEAMSISDQIIVMEKGNIKQIDEPQKLYLQPNNLFVAKFLGNPPINILDAELVNNKLMLGENVVIDYNGENQAVKIGFRPEDVKIDPNGPIEAQIYMVERIGRDNTILCEVNGEKVRGIIDAEIEVNAGDVVRLNIKKQRYYVFNASTGDRI